jgi:hypothetical protein
VPRERLQVRPPGAHTLKELHAELPDVPVATLRSCLEDAAIGEWLPPGTRRVVVLYDARRTATLVAGIPARRAPAKGRRRRPGADPTVAYDLPAGWLTLGELARETGRDLARVRSLLNAHTRRVTALAAELGPEVAVALAALLDGASPGLHLLQALPAEKRIVGGRRQWAYDASVARAVLASGARDEREAEEPWRAFCHAAAKRWAPDEANEREQAHLAESFEARLRSDLGDRKPPQVAATIVRRALEVFAAARNACERAVVLRQTGEELAPLVAAWRAGGSSAGLRAVVRRARQDASAPHASERIEALVTALVGARLVSALRRRRPSALLSRPDWLKDVDEMLSAGRDDGREAALGALRFKVLRRALRPADASPGSKADRARLDRAIMEALHMAERRGATLGEAGVEELARKIAALTRG